MTNNVLGLAIEQAKRYRDKSGPAFDYQAYMVEMLNEIERLHRLCYRAADFVIGNILLKEQLIAAGEECDISGQGDENAKN